MVKNAEANYSVQAEFISSNNEITNKAISFKVEASGKLGKIHYQWNHDTLMIDYQGDDAVQEGELMIIRQRSLSNYGHGLQRQKIQFPHFLKATSGVDRYGVEAGEMVAFIGLPEPEFLVEKSQRGDSAFFALKNTWQWPVCITLVSGDRMLEKTYLKTDWQWKGLIEEDKPLYLKYQYRYKDHLVGKESVLMRNKDRMYVHADQPDQIEPGDSIDIYISVKDHQGNPIPQVDLTAWASNKRFPQDNVPEISDKEHFLGFSVQNQLAYVSQKQNRRDHVQSLDASHIKPLALDTASYYRLRYPDSIAFHYIPLKDTGRIEFAPFLYENGVQKPISLMYCNKILMYYIGAEGGNRFSFFAPSEEVDLSFWAGGWEYSFNNVPLKKGFKTEIFINPSKLPACAEPPVQRKDFTWRQKWDLAYRCFFLEKSLGRRRTSLCLANGQGNYLTG